MGDPGLVGEAMPYVAWLAYRRGEFAQAEELFDEARRLLSGRVGDEQAVVPFFTRGDLALVQDQFDQAAKLYKEGLAHFRLTGNAWGVWDMQAGLAAVGYWRGDVARAATLYWESLHQSHAMQFWPLVVSTLLGLSGIAVETGHLQSGVRLLGAAEGIAAFLGASLFTRDLPIRDRVLAALRSGLGEEHLSAGREAGRTLSVDEAIAEARAVAEVVAGGTLTE
jgi:ATP/maltotriose-dependent transcriptional regulator MalT